MTTLRAPDPTPDVWLSDRSDIMWCTDWDGQQGYGACFGNFWAVWPCRIFPHRWVLLQPGRPGDQWARVIRRCARCGSQVHQWLGVAPPRRGTL